MNNDIKSVDNDWPNSVSMSEGAIYWCIIDNPKLTDNYCHKILNNFKTQTKVCYVSSKINDSFLNDTLNLSSAIERLAFYELPAHAKAYQSLAKDLLSVVHTDKDLFIIIRTSTKIWCGLPQTKLHQFIISMLDILTAQRSRVLIISEGDNSNQLEYRLSIYHALLSGVSKLQERYAQLYYMILWWRTDKQILHEQTWAVIALKENLYLKAKGCSPLRGNIQYDELVIYAHEKVIETKGLVTQRWQIIKSNELIAENAINYHAATVIFSFSSENNIFSLARLVYQTRKTCGDHLKIVVRKCSNTFRHIDMQILLHCGANMVIPFEIHFSAFLTMVRELKGLLFYRQLPEKIEDFLKFTYLEEHKGEVLFSVFIHQVRQRINMPLFVNNDKGILITMVPKMGILPQQAALSCHLNRIGDIYTFSEDKLLLFLSMCGSADVDKLLSNVFPNTLKSLFIRYDVFNIDEEILNYLSEQEHLGFDFITNKAKTRIDEPNLPDLTEAEKFITNPIPQSFSLNLGNLE